MSLRQPDNDFIFFHILQLPTMRQGYQLFKLFTTRFGVLKIHRYSFSASFKPIPSLILTSFEPISFFFFSIFRQFYNPFHPYFNYLLHDPEF